MTAAELVILDGPESYDAWFSLTKKSVPRDLWVYFDPETSTEYVSPEVVTFSSVKVGAQSFHQLSSTERTQFTQLRTLYNGELSQYHRFLSEEAKLQKWLANTVSEAKRTQLRPDKSARDCIKSLQASTKPTDAHMQDLVKARHRVMMGAKYQDWPTVGPDKWILDWQKLMSDCERWCPPFYQCWANDFNLVWGEVTGAQRLCDRLVEATNQNNLQDWNIFRASKELKQAWDQKAIRGGMKVVGKGKITKAAFAVEPQFDGAGVSEEKSDRPQPEPTPLPPTTNPRKRSGTESRQKTSNKRGQRKHCWGCGGDHNPMGCVHIRGSNPRKVKVIEENKRVFQENMKVPDFAGRIGKIREAEEGKKELYKQKNE
jgi:hypothetical protein